MKKGLIAILLVIVFLVGCTSDKTATADDLINVQAQNSGQEEMDGERDQEAGTEEDHLALFGRIDPNKVDASRAMTIIRELSSEKYEGRQAGLAPNEMAEDYIAEIFKNIGLQTAEGLNDYRQLYDQMAAYPVQPTAISILGQDKSYQYQIDFTERFMVGRTYYDLDVVTDMIYVEESSQLHGDVADLDGKVLLVSNSVMRGGIWDLLDQLQKQDIHIEAIILASQAPEAGMRVARGVMSYGDSEFEPEDPVLITCSNAMFDDLVTYSREGNQISISMDYEYEPVEVANIVGVIPGKNAEGPDETLIIGAHLDHVGNNMNGTYNAGALDNASGVSVMIELARIIAESEQPEDTIIFVAFNGEEDGLIGSRYFVEHPPTAYDPDHTIMLNLDMVGSVNEVPLKLCALDDAGSKLVSGLSKLAEAMAVDHTKDNFGSSDHVNFANAGIASVMMIHLDFDYYHTSMDTVDRAIREDRLEDVIRLSLAFLAQEIYQ